MFRTAIWRCGALIVVCGLAGCSKPAEEAPAEAAPPVDAPVAAEAPAEAPEAPEAPAAETAPESQPAAAGTDITPEQLGVPFYPGGEIETSHVATFDNKTTYMVIFATSDEVKTVHEFYAGKLPGNQIASSLSGSGDGQEAYLIHQTDGGQSQHSIAVSREDGQTKVVVSHIVDAP